MKKMLVIILALSITAIAYNESFAEKNTFVLSEPNKCLIVDPKDWHIMDDFSDSATLLVLASEYYEAEDYIHEPYL